MDRDYETAVKVGSVAQEYLCAAHWLFLWWSVTRHWSGPAGGAA